MQAHPRPRSVPASRAIVLFLVLVAGLVTLSPVAAQTSASPSPPPPSGPLAVAASPGACVEPEPSASPIVGAPLSMPEDFRIALFDGVWGAIKDYYIDPDLHGLDWEAIADEYGPAIVSIENAYEVYAVLEEMVGLLEDPYTVFLSPDLLAQPVDPSYGGIGTVLDGGQPEEVEGLRILHVFRGSPAEEAGIRARDRIVAVEGDPCTRVADVRGPAGTAVTLTVVYPGEEPRDVEIERARIDLPITPDARRIGPDGRIGYLQVLSLAGEDTLTEIEGALADFVADEPVAGLILDIRASNRGNLALVNEVLGEFVSGEVGALHTRVETQALEIERGELADDYAGVPVVVLVDGETEAEAEHLAAILQDQGRAVVVGRQTPGLTHSTNDVDFPDGSILQIVSVGFELPDGVTLEGRGVTPDVVVDEDWLAYPEAEDPFIVKALELIASGEADPFEVTGSPAPAEDPAPADSPAPAEDPAPTAEP